MDEASGIDNFINLRLNDEQLVFPEGEDLQTWKPPPISEQNPSNILKFDYVATKKVPKEAKPQRDEVFMSFRKELSNPALSEETKLLMLRSAATTHYWSAQQVRQLVCLIEYPKRVDAVVMLFRRTVDLDQFYNEIWCLLKRFEQQGVRRRLGESLSLLLHKYEPVPPPEEDEEDDGGAVAFMTEIGGGPVQEQEEPMMEEMPVGAGEEGGGDGGYEGDGEPPPQEDPNEAGADGESAQPPMA